MELNVNLQRFFNIYIVSEIFLVLQNVSFLLSLIDEILNHEILADRQELYATNNC